MVNEISKLLLDQSWMNVWKMIFTYTFHSIAKLVDEDSRLQVFCFFEGGVKWANLYDSVKIVSFIVFCSSIIIAAAKYHQTFVIKPYSAIK